MAIFSPALGGSPDLQKGGSHSSSCCQGLRKYVFSRTEDISVPQSFLYLPLCDRAVLLLTFRGLPEVTEHVKREKLSPRLMPQTWG